MGEDDAVPLVDFARYVRDTRAIAAQEPRMAKSVVESIHSEASLHRQRVDRKVILALNSHFWGETKAPQGQMQYCQVRLNELGITATEFQNGVMRVFARAGIVCDHVVVSLQKDQAQIMLPKAEMTSHMKAFVALWHQAKEQREDITPRR